MVDHQLEHQTGLILPKSPTRSNETSITTMETTTMDYKPIASPILQALRSLRDSNPSLDRKLNDHVLDCQRIYTEESNNLPDDSIDYWNKYQQMVVLDQEEFTEIHLGGLMVRIVDVRPFLETLDENDISLCTVDFGGTDIGMDNLLQGMKRSQTWKKLYLGGCGIGSRRGVDDLAKVISLCPDLHLLDLRYNDLSGEDMEKLENVLIKDCKVSILYLEGNRLTCKGAKAIGRIIANNSHLRELYLGSNVIGTDGARALAKGLEQSSSLEKLYLEGNAIADEGALAFTSVLLGQSRAQTKVLQHLYVDNNGLGQDAATKLGRALNSEGLIGGSFFG